MNDELLQRSAAARRAFFSDAKSLLETLTREGQSPDVLFITCSDSRIVPAALFGAKPGDLFVHRNVGNVVPPYSQVEIGSASVLEFALQKLAVSHLVVCGHTDCGAVHGLDAPLDLGRQPALVRWLDLLRPAQRAVDGRSPDFDARPRHVQIVEQNVLLQLENLRTYPAIREGEEVGRLQLHGWVYYLAGPALGWFDPSTGAFTLESPAD